MKCPCSNCGKLIEGGFMTEDGEWYMCDEVCVTTMYVKANLDNSYVVFDEIQKDSDEDYLFWSDWSDVHEDIPDDEVASHAQQ